MKYNDVEFQSMQLTLTLVRENMCQ